MSPVDVAKDVAGPTPLPLDLPEKKKESGGEIAVWMGLAALSAYFGFSVERATNRVLNPVIKKILDNLSTRLPDP